MIIPVKAVVENFLSFRDKQEFEYNTQGVHYIYGINYDSQQSKLLDDTVENNVGVGKSTLAFVMQYAFYGKVQKKINKDKIINKYAGRNLFVQLDFYVDQQLYRIQRYRKHLTHRNQVFLYRLVKDEFQNISDIDPSGTEEKIQKLIVIDNETFQKSGLITREDKSQFLELPTLNRGYIFENLSQLQKLKEYLEKTRRKKIKIESELTTLNTKIIELATIAKRDEQYIEDLKKNFKENQTSLEDKISKLESKIQEISNIGMSVEDILKTIEQHKELHKNMVDTYELIRGIQKIIQDFAKAKDASEKMLETIKTDLTKTQKRFDSHVPTKCHNCGAIQNEDDFNKEHKRIQDILDDLYEREKTELIIFQNHIDNIVEQEEKENDITIIHDDIVAQLRKLPNIDQENIDGIGELQQQLDKTRDDLDSLQYPVDIESLQKEVLDLKAELEVKKKEKDALLLEKEFAEFWLDALDFKSESSIKQFIIGKLIPVFNNLLQQNLEIIYDGTMIVTFDNFFQETIIYDGEVYEYDELSTGEKTKLNFCINISIFDLMRINLDGCKVMFFDEVFVHVDPATIKKFLDIIRNRYAVDNGVYIISHSETVKELCEPQTIIRIEKRNKNSTIFIEKL